MDLGIATNAARDRVWTALDAFRIEVPSWGFANTGTRFGKFVQGGAATTIEEKFADAAQVNALTGASPTVALHVLWEGRCSGDPSTREEVWCEVGIDQSKPFSGCGI
jgi:L-rhamnose isomerase